MTKGKAYGENLVYQKLCRDIIRQLQLQDDLVPYAGDGIDVPFRICGTEVTFDVALQNPQGKLVVVECRRRDAPTKQEAIFAFWGKVDWLRKALGVEVAGIFVTRHRYQIGAVRAATKMGIDVAVCDQVQSPQEFIISYKHYDPQQEAVIQNVKAQFAGSIRPTGSVSATVIRADGLMENSRKLKA